MPIWTPFLVAMVVEIPFNYYYPITARGCNQVKFGCLLFYFGIYVRPVAAGVRLWAGRHKRALNALNQDYPKAHRPRQYATRFRVSRICQRA